MDIFSILDGHKDVPTPPVYTVNKLSTSRDTPMCKCTLQRSYMADDVIRKPVRVGRIRGTMFIPNSELKYFNVLLSKMLRFWFWLKLRKAPLGA